MIQKHPEEITHVCVTNIGPCFPTLLLKPLSTCIFKQNTKFKPAYKITLHQVRLVCGVMAFTLSNINTAEKRGNIGY